MPKFYIHFLSNQGLANDPEGTDFPSLADARGQALVSARELIANDIKAGSARALEAVIIADERGHVLTTIPADSALPASLRG